MDLLSILSADNYHDRFHPSQAPPRNANVFHSLEQLDLEYQTRYDRARPCYVFEKAADQDGEDLDLVAQTEERKDKKRGPGPEAEQRREPPKKKRRPSKSNTEDVEAVVKRRAQLRTAQAAYRSRQDATISSLKTEVSMLQKTNEEMKVLLSELHQDLIGKGLLGGDEWAMDVGEFLMGLEDRNLKEGDDDV